MLNHLRRRQMYEIIADLRNLSNPPQSEIDKHAQKVQEVIQKLGNNYRLALPVPKLEKGAKK